MQHCTPETLALAALREPLPEPDTAHLAGCPTCRAEVTSLQRSVGALAVPEFAAPSGAVAPPSSVWGAIAAATGVTATPRPDVVTASAEEPAPAVRDSVPPARDAGDVVREFPPRRGRLLLAMAASLLVGAGIGAGAVALSDRDAGDAGDELVAADLEPLDDRGALGSAAVVERDGTRILQVDLEAPATDDGYYEVWLLEPDAQAMFSIGVVQAGSSTLELPPGIDLDAFPVVDVSVEALDGDPTHSGVSVARGVLDS